MTVMYLLIAFSLIIATGFVLAFVWAIRSGQYDDKYTPSIRVLFDDDKPSSLKNEVKSETSISRLTNSEINQTATNSTQTTNESLYGN